MKKFHLALICLTLVSLGLSSGCALMKQEQENPLAADTAIHDLSSDGLGDEQENAWSKFTPSGIAKSVRQVTGNEPNEQKARESFAEAEVEFRSATSLEGGPRQKAFVSASKRFVNAGKHWPESALEEEALFMAAEGLFFADYYPKAAERYQELVKKYPNSRYMEKVSARQFALAEYWLNLHRENPRWISTPNFMDNHLPRFDTFGQALRVFDRIRLDDPTGKLSDDATMAAGKASFLAKKYERAETFFTDLRESFPDSDHQFEAHLLGLKCKMMLYRGPDYDATVLDESENLVRQTFRLFPEEVKDHRAYLEEALADIRLKKAGIEWTLAKYYDRRKEYGAAKFYYDIVRRDYSDTNLGQEAHDRLAELGGLPDDPPQRLAWLARLFPTPEQQKPLISRDGIATMRR